MSTCCAQNAHGDALLLNSSRPPAAGPPPPQELLQQEANVTHVKAPVVVVGDTHGQFHDLLEIFKIAGSPSKRGCASGPPHACCVQTRPSQLPKRPAASAAACVDPLACLCLPPSMQAAPLTPTICSWGTTWTAATTAWRLCAWWWRSRCSCCGGSPACVWPAFCSRLQAGSVQHGLPPCPTVPAC